jgi:hypothetical protein
MIWSFSRIHLYELCAYAFYKKYIEEANGDDNWYAENGSIMHMVFQKVLSREINISEAPALYIDEFDNIYSKINEKTSEDIFNKCLDYLCTVEDLDKDRYEILEVEKKLEFKISKYNLVGYADLILRDKKDNSILLVDHKSSDHFFKKDGTVLKNQEDNFYAYRHQMYLYCKGIYDKYNEFPSKIIWHHFKDNGKLSIIPFCQTDYEETIKQWVPNTIKKIYMDRRFLENTSYMHHKILCDFRYSCEYKDD